MISALILCFFVSIHGADPLPEGTRAGKPKLLKLADFPVVSKNLVYLSYPSVLNGDSLSRVDFSIAYSQYVSNKIHNAHQRLLVRSDSAPPFEAAWDCSDIKDQDQGSIIAMVEIWDGHGKKIRGYDRANEQTFTLDRNPNLNKKTLSSFFSDAAITIDGNLDDWEGLDSEKISLPNLKQ